MKRKGKPSAGMLEILRNLERSELVNRVAA
jgi:hypothetical protein